MKKTISSIIFIFSGLIFSQEPSQSSLFTPLLDNLSVSYESISQWYLNDSYVDSQGINTIGDEELRTTNYLRLDYSFNDNFSAGLQLESYMKQKRYLGIWLQSYCPAPPKVCVGKKTCSRTWPHNH